MLTFSIPGRIGGKGRPKFARRGNFVTAYTPEKTRTMESMVKGFAAKAMRDRPMFEGPVSFTMSVFLHCPASWSKKRKAQAKWVTGTPDCDNIAKLASDSFNGIVWNDDAQVAVLQFSRRYRNDAPEEVLITVEALT